jgi:glyoxylase-like metal-dependent hydrolase (beta-lactamase superfamily II)
MRQNGVDRRLETLPDVEILSLNVIRILGKNPGRMTLQGTNTYLIGQGPSRILIDTGDGNTKYLTILRQVCKLHQVEEITDVLLTHSHFDHMGGILGIKELFPNVKIWKHFPKGARGDKFLTISNQESLLLDLHNLRDGAEFRTFGAKLRAEYTPGHIDDHMCFWMEEEKQRQSNENSKRLILFSGDCVLGSGSCVFDNLNDLMLSFEKLRQKKPHLIYPGHGPVVHDTVKKIEEYMTHRLEREHEILKVLDSNTKKKWSSQEIVSRIYQDLPFMLRFAAKKNVEIHLEKLSLEERVVVHEKESGVFPMNIFLYVGSNNRRKRYQSGILLDSK